MRFSDHAYGWLHFVLTLTEYGTPLASTLGFDASPEFSKLQPPVPSRSTEVVMGISRSKPSGSETWPIAEALYNHASVNFVHYHWVDYFGILRVRVFTRSHCLAMATQQRPLRVAASSLAPGADEYVSPMQFSQVGADCMYPDGGSMRILDSERRHASVFCVVSAEKNNPCLIADISDPYYRCPRSVLRRTVAYANSKLNVELLAGFELEFYLLDKTDASNAPPSKEVDAYWSTASSLRTAQGDCVESCVKALQEADIVVEQYHAEGSQHQFEIVTGPLLVLEAVDTLMQSQEIIKRTALKRGLQATFLPKPFLTRCSSGLHAHLALRSAQQDVEKVENHFLAGMLHRLPMTCAFGMPSPGSYLRLGWPMLGEWVAWGTENRDAPIRKIDSAHWEIRTIDVTANMYLAMAASIAAGILGIENQEQLLWKDCRLPIGSMEEEDRKRLGITDRLPRTCDESIGSWKPDYKGLDTILGKEFLEFYRLMRRCDQKKLSTLDESEQAGYFQKEF